MPRRYATLGRGLLGRLTLGRGVDDFTAWEQPSHVAEEDYQAGTGTITLTWTTAQESLEAGDLFVLYLECQGGEEPADNTGMTDWTFLEGRGSGTGTAHVGMALFVHRYDGTTLPTIASLPDTGNHSSYSLNTFRGIDRNITLTDLFNIGVTDSTADTTFYSRTIDDADGPTHSSSAPWEQTTMVGRLLLSRRQAICGRALRPSGPLATRTARMAHIRPPRVCTNTSAPPLSRTRPLSRTLCVVRASPF
jgi:hypothetical protein